MSSCELLGALWVNKLHNIFIYIRTRLVVHAKLDTHTKLDSMQNLSALLTPSLISTYNSTSSQSMTSIEKFRFIICCKNFSSFHEKNRHFLQKTEHQCNSSLVAAIKSTISLKFLAMFLALPCL